MDCTLTPYLSLMARIIRNDHYDSFGLTVNALAAFGLELYISSCLPSTLWLLRNPTHPSESNFAE